MGTWRTGAILLCLTTAHTTFAQSHSLTEPAKSGDCFRYELVLTVKGELRVGQEGKIRSIPLAAGARHKFVERLLDVKDKGLPVKVARHYEQADAQTAVDGQTSSRGLRPDRRLIVAQRTPERFLCYSPSGPLTREELEVAGEHFDTLSLTGLLPEKEVRAAESWRLPNEVVLAIAQFEALISHDLTAKLEEVADGHAIIMIGGKAQGIEMGALAKITVSGKAKFEILTRRLTHIEWTQKDERDQGPASPASTVEATTTVKRTAIETPKELADGALESVPKGLEPPPAVTAVSHRDSKGRYEVSASRDWTLVAQTENHLVLRLVERGELTAQVSMTPWTKVDAGKHTTADEFKKILAETPGWQLEELLEEGEVPAEGGRWIFRVAARGQMEDVKVVQTFYLIAAPTGEQVVATFTMKPGQTSKLGSKDLSLIGGLAFPKK